MDTIHERIKYIIKNEKTSIQAFERELKVGPNSISTALRRKSVIGHVVIQRIATRYPNYSLSWLVLGAEESPKEKVLNQIYELVRGIG